MEENKSLSFDQLPSAVGELLTKVNTMMTRLDDIGQRIGNAPSENDHVLMDIREASAFVRKKVSSLYAYTSERRIPFYKRGNTLYFFKDQLIKWIEAGGLMGQALRIDPGGTGRLRGSSGNVAEKQEEQACLHEEGQGREKS